MQIRPKNSELVIEGKLTGNPVLHAVDRQGRIWSPAMVEYIIPDDEAQAATVRRAGYLTHTPLTVVLDGLISSEPNSNP